MQDAHGKNTFYMKNGLCQDCQKSLKNIIDNQWESKPTKILLIILSQEFRNNYTEPKIQVNYHNYTFNYLRTDKVYS